LENTEMTYEVLKLTLPALLLALVACSPQLAPEKKGAKESRERKPQPSASFFTGVELHERLADWKRNPSKDIVSAAVGYGFVVGVADAIHGYKEPRTGFCYSRPDRVTTTELVDVVHAYLKERPQSAQLSAWSIVAAALSEKYPCS
jgi:hypothetical protein